MTKVKINSGLMALMIVASLFVGWQTMLLVTVLLFAFFEVDENVKNVAIKVITFYIGLTIVSAFWGLVVDGIGLVTGSLDKIFATINTYLDYTKMIEINKFISPINSIVKIADDIVNYLFVFVKLGFIIAILTGKNKKDNFIMVKINGYVNSALNFINNFGAPMQTQNTVQQQPPVQQATQMQESVQPAAQVPTQNDVPNEIQNNQINNN